ncbi:hypothetical protein DFH09DRAFT_1075962 [Mycena vulgaris]|nr:hypothetical protein DFH09DRAFT_1075962 [Mycena vulgaris]
MKRTRKRRSIRHTRRRRQRTTDAGVFTITLSTAHVLEIECALEMVGHTGSYDAAVSAISHTEAAVGTVYDPCPAAGYVLLTTADLMGLPKPGDPPPLFSRPCPRFSFFFLLAEMTGRSRLARKPEGK